MPEFMVSLPLCGYIVIEIVAKNEKEAIQKALRKSYNNEDIAGFEVLENIYNGDTWKSSYLNNDAEAELLDEDPDCTDCKEKDCKGCVFNDEE